MYFHSVQLTFCEEMFKMIDDPSNSLEFLRLQFKASQKLDVKEKNTKRTPVLPIEQHRKSKKALPMQFWTERTCHVEVETEIN